MRYIFLFLITAAITACTGTDKYANSGNAVRDSLNRVAMADTAAYTSIQWLDSTSQDLGKIVKGQVVEISWRFKNTGNKPLVISSVTPGCGCTIADKPEEPVAPGNEGVIKAKFDSQNQHTGENTKSVTVVANTKEQSVHSLTFRVNLTDK